MLSIEKLEAAQELCQLLMWDNLPLAKRCFGSFKASVSNEDDGFDLAEPLRTALRPVLCYRDWNELDVLLDDLQEQITRRCLPIRFDAPSEYEDEDEDEDKEERFNCENPDEFLAQINDVMTEYGFNLWCWETESSAYCVLITRNEDRESIYHLAYQLGFFEDSGAELRCCDVVG